MFVTPVFALELYSDKIQSQFDNPPDEYANATYVALADSWVEGKTNARHSTADSDYGSYDYIYLKADGLGNYTVKFTVAEDGFYKFGFKIMGWTASVLRSTNVYIDDSKNVYIAYDYVEEDQFKPQYWTGISAVLTAGEHSVTLSLADDFDDSSVKSLYFESFFYVKEDLPTAEETPAEASPSEAASAEAAPAEATLDETPAVTEEQTSAPIAAAQTSDGIFAAINLLALSSAACTLMYRRKNSDHSN